MIITFLKVSIDIGTVLATERHVFTYAKKEPLTGVEAVLLTGRPLASMNGQLQVQSIKFGCVKLIQLNKWQKRILVI